MRHVGMVFFSFMSLIGNQQNHASTWPTQAGHASYPHKHLIHATLARKACKRVSHPNQASAQSTKFLAIKFLSLNHFFTGQQSFKCRCSYKFMQKLM